MEIIHLNKTNRLRCLFKIILMNMRSLHCFMFCFVLIWWQSIYPYASGLIYRQWGDLSVKQPGQKWGKYIIKIPLGHDDITTAKLSTTKQWAYSMGCTKAVSMMTDIFQCTCIWLTHLSLDKMADIFADNNFKCIFFNENNRILIRV